MDSTLFIGLTALGLALPGLLARRFGAWGVRLVALSALAVVWYAAMDWPRQDSESIAPHVVAVTTGDSIPPELIALEARLNAVSGTLEVLRGDLEQNLAVASLRPRVMRDGLLLLWTDPFEPRPATGAVTPGVRAFTTTAPPRIEPLDFELRSFVRFEVGRPAGLELRFVARDIDPLKESWSGKVRVQHGTDLIVEHNFSARDFVEPIRFEFDVAQAGNYDVQLEVDLGNGSQITGTQITACARFEAQPPRPVLLVGGDSTLIEKAFAVQGIPTVAHATLPADLEPVRTVVLLARVEPADQQRLVRFVEDGGGLFLVGAKDLGGLPRPDEPLAKITPVTVLEPEPATVGDQPGGSNPDSTSPDTSPPKVDPAKPDAPDTKQLPDEKPDEEPDLATGEIDETTTATELEKTEVDRRHVALVLIIDRSQSMSISAGVGKSRMDYARSAAFETAILLRPEDHLGVVSFGEGAATQIIKLGPVPSRGQLISHLGGLVHENEGTDLRPGLKLARKILSSSKLAIRHAVVITDAEFMQSLVPRLQVYARKMAVEEGITVSMIHLPDNPLLRNPGVARIAAFGKGQYVMATDPSTIPRLLLAEVQRVSGIGGKPEDDPLAKADADADKKPDVPEVDPAVDKPQVEDPPAEDPPKAEPEPPSGTDPTLLRVRAVADSVLVEPRPDQGYPNLGGIARVRGRPDSRVLLVAGQQGVPLLAFANRGLGRIGAWTSDILGPWGVAWREDPSFPGRLGAWVEHLRPAEPIDLSQDLLTDRSLTPPAPLRAERTAMLTVARGPLAPISSYEPPSLREVEVEHGMAREDAIFALISLMFLLLVEWSLSRFSGRLTVET